MAYVNPDHLIPLFAFIFGIPAMAISARWVLKPMVDAFVRSRELKAGAPADPAGMEAHGQRIAQLESELGSLRQEVERLTAVESFYAQLQAGHAPPGHDLSPGDRQAASG